MKKTIVHVGVGSVSERKKLERASERLSERAAMTQASLCFASDCSSNPIKKGCKVIVHYFDPQNVLFVFN